MDVIIQRRRRLYINEKASGTYQRLRETLFVSNRLLDYILML
jgi:hypothetical protein